MAAQPLLTPSPAVTPSNNCFMNSTDAEQTTAAATELEQTGPLARIFHLSIEGSRIEKEESRQVKTLAAQMRLPGFRPGKTPLTLVRQRYGGDLRQKSIEDLVRDRLREKLSEYSLEAVSPPVISSVKTEDNGDVSVQARFDIFPEINLKSIAEQTLEQAICEVGSEDVDRALERLARENPDWKPVDRAAREGDMLEADLACFADGKPLPNLDQKKQNVLLDKTRSRESVVTALIGVKAGEERTVQIPSPYKQGALAGRELDCRVSTLSVRQPEPAKPEAYLENLASQGNTDAKAVRERLEKACKQQAASDLRSYNNSLCMEMVNAIEVKDLPQALLDQENRNAKARGDEENSPQVEKRIRTALVMRTIMTEAGIDIDKIEKGFDPKKHLPPGEARTLPPQQLEYARQHHTSTVSTQMVTDWIRSQATIKSKAMTLAELEDWKNQPPPPPLKSKADAAASTSS